jgi:hypothetical protein
MQHLSNTTGTHSNFLRRYALKKDHCKEFPLCTNSGNIADNKFQFLNFNKFNQRYSFLLTKYDV